MTTGEAGPEESAAATGPVAWARREWPLLVAFAVPLLYSLAKNARTRLTTFDEDEVVYYDYGFRTAYSLFKGQPIQAWTESTQTYRPPLAQFWDAVMILLFGNDPWRLSLLRTPWSWALIACAAVLGRDLARRAGHDARTVRRVGWLAAIFAACSPLVLQLGITLMAEVPLAVCVGFTLVSVVRSQGFRHRGWTLAVAVGCFCGLLTKWTFPLFVAGPMAWEAARSLWSGAPGSWHPSAEPRFATAPGRRWWQRRWHPVLGGAVVIAGIGACLVAWYWPAWDRVYGFLTDVAVGEGALRYGARDRNVYQEYGFFFVAMGDAVAWLPVSLLIWAGVFQVGRQAVPSVSGTAEGPPRLPRAELLLLAGALALPFGLFTSLRNKEVRYLLALIPAIAPAAALGLAGRGWLTPQKIRWRVGGVLALLVIQVGSYLPRQGMEPFVREGNRFGPFGASWTPGSEFEWLPTGLHLTLPIGELDLWSRRMDFFPYRRVVDPMLRLHQVAEIAGDSVAQWGPRWRGAVLNTEPWVWTPLWAHAEAQRQRVGWRCAACDVDEINEGFIFVVMLPLDREQACPDENNRVRHAFQELANQSLERVVELPVEMRKSFDGPRERGTISIFRRGPSAEVGVMPGDHEELRFR